MGTRQLLADSRLEMMTSRLTFNFKGLMAPVFTCFHPVLEDFGTISISNRAPSTQFYVEQCVNTDIIDSYAKHLATNGIRGVLVNGSTGEGPSLTIAERKLTTEKWQEACKKYELTLMVQIGGAGLMDVIDLAKHAAELNVDAVLCLPELYFKPKTITNLVRYLKQVAQHCANIPFLYYHIPQNTGLHLHMPTFCNQAELEINNFVGIKYTSTDLDLGIDCLRKNRNVFLGADTIFTGALALGFDSAIMTILNIYPELPIRIMNHMEANQLNEAREIQAEMTKLVKNILRDGGGDWVPSMKKAFIAKTTLNAGPVRLKY